MCLLSAVSPLVLRVSLTSSTSEGSGVLFSLLVALIVSSLVTQVAVFSTTIYLHRTATHRAIVLHPVVEWCFRFAIWVTTGIVPDEWVAVHLKHHAFTDEVGDPHSPALE